MTPTARTLQQLRKEGFTAAVVERWNPHARIRQDLFGFGDVIFFPARRLPAAMVAHGATLAQVTSSSNTSARLTKILAEPRAQKWLQAGNQIEIHGWAKRGKRGERKLWTLKIQNVTLADFPLMTST